MEAAVKDTVYWSSLSSFEPYPINNLDIVSGFECDLLHKRSK